MSEAQRRFNELAQQGQAAKRRMEEETPAMSWVDMATQAVANTPSSALQFGEDLVQPILHPIDTAESIIDLGFGIAQLAIPGEQADEKTARAVGAYFVDRYGSIEDAKRTFARDPVGFIGDASMVITGGATAAVRAPGKIGAIAKKVQAAGNAIDPVNVLGKTVKAGGGALSKGVAAGLGVTTGTSGQSVREAFQAGREGGDRRVALTENMRDQVDVSEVVDDAREGLQKVKEQTRKEFKESKAALELEKIPVAFEPIQQAVKDLEQSFIYEGFNELSREGRGKMAEVNKLIKDFSNNPRVQTAYGLDALKRSIDDLYPRGINPGNEAVVVARARDIVKEAILDQAPDYNKVMRPYEQARRLEVEMQKALSLGNNAAADTALRKLQSVMRDNVNANFGSRLKLVEQLEKAGDVMLIPKVAGQDLKAIAPRGLGRVAGGGAAFGAASNPALLAALPFTSPRLVGEGALAAGDGVRMAGNALSAAQQRISDLPNYRNLSADAGLRYAADSATSQPVADARRLRTGGVLDRAATEESESDARIRQLLNLPQSALIQ